MIKCFACGVSFDVEFEEADADARFCPHCGQETIDDVQLIEEYSVDSELLYDEDEDDL
jgi:rRNA maturation endonuclease Nob1